MFLRYLDIKAINAASARNVMTRQDVKFWLEVQKFKVCNCVDQYTYDHEE